MPARKAQKVSFSPMSLDEARAFSSSLVNPGMRLAREFFGDSIGSVYHPILAMRALGRYASAYQAYLCCKGLVPADKSGVRVYQHQCYMAMWDFIHHCGGGYILENIRWGVYRRPRGTHQSPHDPY
jgi:hypothetical protein